MIAHGDGLYTEVTTNGYSTVVEEPAGFGGTGAGPTPYDYLLAALGSRAVMMVRMRAASKGRPLKSVRVHMKHSNVHAKDCEECETENGSIDRIELELELEAPSTSSSVGGWGRSPRSARSTARSTRRC